MTADRAEEGRRGRRAALVIAVAFIAWMALQWLGGTLGWPPALALVFDLAAFVALGWALAEAVRLWRARQQS